MNKKINLQHLFTDLLISVCTFYGSLFIRVNFDEAMVFLPALHRVIPIVVVCRLIFFLYFETHNIIWRYVSAVDAFRLAKAILGSTVAIVALSYFFQVGTLPRSIFIIDALLLLSLLASFRLARRLYHETISSKEVKRHGEKTLIYGAGVTGQGVLKRLQMDKNLKLSVIGFVDDSPLKIGKSISGFKVFGSIDQLEDLIRNLEVKSIVVGIPDPSKEILTKLVQITAPFGIKPKLVNSATDIESTQSTFREIELQDLLVRPPHKIDVTSTQEMIKGKRVLITGAGGSIGSEISRQVLSFGPSQVVLLDHSEFNLYSIDHELKNGYSLSELIIPALVDIRDTFSMDDIFSRYRPEIVFHAAAYKHVHLVEANPYSSIINNIEGTQNLLACCQKYSVEHFVQISSDKAVNPAGVMGATKRVCEIMTSIVGLQTGKFYSSVRFGNVLGSSGSLIPLLKKQIEDGKPLTITHKEMTRYFMLIEEAVSLVLKAASISQPGDVNVLRMGEPIKIIDIAENLIRLMGRTKEEVQINFTGLRPGEKMFEELYISGKELNTEHPDILVLPKGDALPAGFSNDEFKVCIQQIIDHSRRSDRDALVKLGSLVNTKYFTSLRVLSPANEK